MNMGQINVVQIEPHMEKTTWNLRDTHPDFFGFQGSFVAKDNSTGSGFQNGYP